MFASKNRYRRRSRISEKYFRGLIRAFALDLAATDAGNYQAQTASLARIHKKERMRQMMMAQSVRPMGGLPMPSQAAKRSRHGDVIINAYGQPVGPTAQTVSSAYPTPRYSPTGTHP